MAGSDKIERLLNLVSLLLDTRRPDFLFVSPQLNPIERLWKVLRRRATHNRLFDALTDLKKSLRASLCYFQTMRTRVQTLLQSARRQKANQTVSSSVCTRGQACRPSYSPSASP